MEPVWLNPWSLDGPGTAVAPLALGIHIEKMHHEKGCGNGGRAVAGSRQRTHWHGKRTERVQTSHSDPPHSRSGRRLRPQQRHGPPTREC